MKKFIFGYFEGHTGLSKIKLIAASSMPEAWLKFWMWKIMHYSGEFCDFPQKEIVPTWDEVDEDLFLVYDIDVRYADEYVKGA